MTRLYECINFMIDVSIVAYKPPTNIVCSTIIVCQGRHLDVDGEVLRVGEGRGFSPNPVLKHMRVCQIGSSFSGRNKHIV